MIDQDRCEGCNLYKHHLAGIKNREKCPCNICIVKMMCNEACRKYEQWSIVGLQVWRTEDAKLLSYWKTGENK